MIQSNILFLFFFLTLPLLSFPLKKQNTTNDRYKKEKISYEKNLSIKNKEIERDDFGEELNFTSKPFKSIKLKEKKKDNDRKFKKIQNSRKKLYLNFAFGSSNLKNYDVYNTSNNEAIWDDRYTKSGSSFEIGLGYDFGKVRTEITYAQENGRFDEYLTYRNNSITKIDSDRGKLHKDFYIINSFYDFRDDKRISPYIGLGLGFVNSSQDSAPFIPEYVRQVFVLQLKGGFSYKISEKNYIYIEGFKRDSNSHITSDGLGTPYIYEAKDGFDSSGLQIGYRKIL